MMKTIYLVLTICLQNGLDCSVWVPDRWQGDDATKELASCESFAMSQNYGLDTDWQCVEEGQPGETLADYQDGEGWSK